jgi:hypothetical protein
MVAEFPATRDNTTNIFFFNKPDGVGNTGLYANCADYVFLFDPWWNNARTATGHWTCTQHARAKPKKSHFAYKMILVAINDWKKRSSSCSKEKKEPVIILIGDTRFCQAA